MLGVLSLVLWTLFIITSVKYVLFAMRVDNDGEGGILALMALLGVKQQHRPTDRRVRPVRRGADLWRRRDHAGDLGAVGAGRAEHGDAGAAALCRAGRGRDPARAVRDPAAGHGDASARASARSCCSGLWPWRLLGICGIAQHPAVLAALNPLYGLRYLLSNGFTGFLVLGGVFLCVTGAEALYADMGHFGAGRSGSPGSPSCFRA